MPTKAPIVLALLCLWHSKGSMLSFGHCVDLTVWPAPRHQPTLMYSCIHVWPLTGLVQIHTEGEIQIKRRASSPCSYGSVIERQSSVCLIRSNLPMITASLGDIQRRSRWQSFQHVGSGSPHQRWRNGTNLYSGLARGVLCAITEGSHGPWNTLLFCIANQNHSLTHQEKTIMFLFLLIMLKYLTL